MSAGAIPARARFRRRGARHAAPSRQHALRGDPAVRGRASSPPGCSSSPPAHCRSTAGACACCSFSCSRVFARLLPLVLAARRADAGDEDLAHPRWWRRTATHACAAGRAAALRLRAAAGADARSASSGRWWIATASSCTTAWRAACWFRSPSPLYTPERTHNQGAGARSSTIISIAGGEEQQARHRGRGDRRPVPSAARRARTGCSACGRRCPSMMPRNTLMPTMPERACMYANGSASAIITSVGERVEELLPQRDLVALGLLPVAGEVLQVLVAASRPTCARAPRSAR